MTMKTMMTAGTTTMVVAAMTAMMTTMVVAAMTMTTMTDLSALVPGREVLPMAAR